MWMDVWRVTLHAVPPSGDHIGPLKSSVSYEISGKSYRLLLRLFITKLGKSVILTMVILWVPSET